MAIVAAFVQYARWAEYLDPRRHMPIDLAQSYRIDPNDLPSDAVIFGSTAAMSEVQCNIERTLNSDLPALIRGERGTDKESSTKCPH